MESCTGDNIDDQYWQMSSTSAYFDAVGGDGKPVRWAMCDGPFVAVARAAMSGSRAGRQPLPLPLNRKDAGSERYEVGAWGDFRPWGTGDGSSVAIQASQTPACVEHTASWAARKQAAVAAYKASGRKAEVNAEHAVGYKASGRRTEVGAKNAARWLPLQAGLHSPVHIPGGAQQR